MGIFLLVLTRTVICILSVLAFLLIVCLIFMWPGKKRKELQDSFLGHWYAHRGYHDNKSDAPENSLKAFGLAVERGFGIELDVQLTKDEKVVVFHDNDLKRVCGVDAKVNSKTYEELQELTLLSSNERIPLFTEVLEVIGGKVPIIVEIKMVDAKTRVCELANDILKDYKGQFCIESFHPYAVKWFKEHRPELMRGQLSANFRKEGEPENFGAWLVHFLLTNIICKPDFIAYSCKSADNISFRFCTKVLGALPVAWTIKSKELLLVAKEDYKIFIFEGFDPSKVEGFGGEK